MMILRSFLSKTTTTTTTMNIIRLILLLKLIQQQRGIVSMSLKLVQRPPSSSSSITTTAVSYNKNCIIVGGGPVGLATALTLANAPHYYNVTVLESIQSMEEYINYDPTKAYLYNINSKGLEWFYNNHDITTTSTATTNDTTLSSSVSSPLQQLHEYGYSPTAGSMGNFIIVPANPETIIPSSNTVTVRGNNNSSNKNDTNDNTSTTTSNLSPQQASSFWIPRYQMIQLLYNCCLEHNNKCSKDSTTTTKINIYINKKVQNIFTTSGSYDDNECGDTASTLISVQCGGDDKEGSANDDNIYTGSLIVAADGINSIVRKSLQEWNHNKHKFTRNKFLIRKYKSPSTGLHLKALQFHPNLRIQNGTTNSIHDDQNENNSISFVQPQSTDIVVLRGKSDGYRNRLSIGMFPIKDPNQIRLGNTIVPYNHEILSNPYCNNSTAMKLWFINNFPRIQWDECLASDNEWDRYVQSRGVIYPYCQYSPGSAYVIPPKKGKMNEALCGIVMVGDACHAFPPDLGQGMNAGLQDVVALDYALQNKPIHQNMITKIQQRVLTSPLRTRIVSLGTALHKYEANRRPEHAALIRLARFGNPYQYRQPWLRHRIGSTFWKLNVLFRLIMNRISFGIIPPAAIMILTSKPQFSYREVMLRADTTAFCFQWILLAALIRCCLLRWPLLLRVPTLLWIKTSYVETFRAASTTLLASTLVLIVLKVIVPLLDEIECLVHRDKQLFQISNK